MKTTKIALSILCFTLLFSTAMLAQTKPKFVTMNAIKEHASYVFSGTKSYFQSENCDNNCLKAYIDKANSALEALTEAEKGGIAKTETINIATNDFNGKANMTLQEVQDGVFEALATLNIKYYTHRLTSHAQSCDKWFPELSDGTLDMSQAMVAVEDGKALKKVIGEAQKVGIASDIKVKTFKGEYSLGDLRELAKYCESAADKRLKAIMAAAAAHDAPFLSGLKGDKLQVFKSEFAGNSGMWLCLTSGKRELKSVADLSGASVWYTSGHNTRGILDVWHITGYVFSDDKLVKTTSSNGFGISPSTANFK